MTSSSKRLRVLVVDDSAVHRQVLAGVLGRDADIEIAGYATNGAEALRAVEQLRPDVITLDEKMPVMNGLEAARLIMRDWPTPIVMVTAQGGARGRELTDAALAAGALAVQDKRALAGHETGAGDELVRIVKSMAAVRLVRRRRETVVAERALTPALSQREREAGPPEIIAIGASTGGPQTIRSIVSKLPADFALPIVVVQHTTAGYAHTFVDWLRAETALPVEIARDGQALSRGIHVAPTERHLVVRGRYLALLDAPPCSLHRPSATVLFQSVADAFGSRAIGVLLTGMGDDGAAGLLEMHQVGAMTIAQDEASSVVYGMPAEAVRRGAAQYVLTPEAIADVLCEQAALTPTPSQRARGAVE